VQQRLVAAGLLKGKTVAVDATTLEANAAMRSIVLRAGLRATSMYVAAVGSLATCRRIRSIFSRKRSAKLKLHATWPKRWRYCRTFTRRGRTIRPLD
jgi:transposase